MPKNYILIDLENTQPENLILLNEVDEDVAEFHLLIFVGAKQKSIPTKIVIPVHAMSVSAEYIQCSISKKNAVDFMLIYHLGKLVAEDPNAYFHIIARDKDYDSLIPQLRDQGLRAYRHEDIRMIPVVPGTIPKNVTTSKPAPTHKAKPSKNTQKILDIFTQNRRNRPRLKKTLKNKILSDLKMDKDANADAVIEELKQLNWVKTDGEKVVYINF